MLTTARSLTSQKSVAVFMTPRALAVALAVFSAHVILLAAMLLLPAAPPAPPPQAQALASPTIMAQLLSPAAPAPPVAQPQPPQPRPPQAKPKAVPKTAPPQRAAVNPQPAPQPQPQPAAPEAAPSAPATPALATAPATAAAPAAGPESMAISAPKNVSHLDCEMAKPEYPALSRRRGEAGTVQVRFVVGLTGKIEHAELKKSSGFSRLDNAALAAIRATVCRPYLENGQPIRVTYTQPYNFGLTD